MKGAQGADKTTKEPSKEKGKNHNPDGPPNTFDPEVPWNKRCQRYQWVELEKEGYRIIQFDILFRGDGNGVIHVDVLGKTAFDQQKNEENEKKGLA